MSGIEVLTNFFENIRPRYSWSSSETVATNSDEPSSSSCPVAVTNDGEQSDRTLVSPPTSPMHGIEVTGDDCGVYTDTEEDGDDSEDLPEPMRRSENELEVAMVVAAAMERADATAGTTNQPIMPPSEGPSNTIISSGSNAPETQQHIPSISDPPLSVEPSPSANVNPSAASLAIPEDDGHQILRERLLEIQRSNLSERERAQHMHLLMTEKYLSKASHRGSISPSSSRPRSLIEGSPFSITEEDKEPSYSNEEEGILGCKHYKRNVKLQCSTCDKWYPCRFCHDEKEDHSLIRRDTKNMLCMRCGTAQAAAQTCRQCVRYAATYYCDKCKLWDDDSAKTIYHCNDCGICRIGRGLGKDFFHCKKCGVCMSIELEGQHRCIERSTDCDCPICGDYLFTSIMTVVFMTCGHSIHLQCYNDHMKNSYRCPTCAKSVFNMETRFRYLDYEIQRQPLPDPYKYWHCHIICNDCSAKSDVPFHFLGLKCDTCKSYNTCEVKLIRPEDQPGNESAALLLSSNRLPPPHLMPNPETAGTIVPGEEVVTDLASVLREIEGRDGQPESSTNQSIESSDESECSCRSHHHENDGNEDEDSLYDSDSLGSDDLDGDDDEDDLVDEEPASLNIIHLPGHP